jgi:hypothetical protein
MVIRPCLLLPKYIMMAAIRNIGKTSDKSQQLFRMAPDLIGEKVVVSSAPYTTRRAILSGSLVESPDVWVAEVIQDDRGGGFRRENTIYTEPRSLPPPGTKLYVTSCGDRWDGEVVLDATGKTPLLKFNDVIYKSPSAVCAAHAKRVTPNHPKVTQPGNGWRFLLYAEGPMKGKPISEASPPVVAIYRSPRALCTGHSRRITLVHSGATEGGDGWKFIVVLTGKYAGLTLGEIYDTLDKAVKEEERKEEERKEEERKEEERKEEERKEAERKEQERKELQRILLLERREEIQRELVALQNEIEAL